jgi:type IV pilus assembly protein PilV
VKHRLPPSSSAARRTGARGVGLIDALISLVILSFGMLALAGFQARLVKQGTESLVRLSASALGDELQSYALVDVNNKACYQRPAPGNCSAPAASAAAAAYAASWADRVASGIPGYQSASAALDGSGARFTVTIRWRSKDNDDIRTQESATDVR